MDPLIPAFPLIWNDNSYFMNTSASYQYLRTSVECLISQKVWVKERKLNRIALQHHNAGYVVCISHGCNSGHLSDLISSRTSSFHLLRVYLVIHPTKVVYHSIWMTSICPAPWLPTAFSLLLPPGKNTKPPRNAPASPSSLPEGLPSQQDLLWPWTLSHSLPFQASGPEFWSLRGQALSLYLPAQDGSPLFQWVMSPGFSHYLDPIILSLSRVFSWFFALLWTLGLALLVSVGVDLLLWKSESVVFLFASFGRGIWAMACFTWSAWCLVDVWTDLDQSVHCYPGVMFYWWK